MHHVTPENLWSLTTGQKMIQHECLSDFWIPCRSEDELSRLVSLDLRGRDPIAALPPTATTGLLASSRDSSNLSIGVFFLFLQWAVFTNKAPSSEKFWFFSLSSSSGEVKRFSFLLWPHSSFVPTLSFASKLQFSVIRWILSRLYFSKLHISLATRSVEKCDVTMVISLLMIKNSIKDS